jgi:hypothetical protein
MASRRDAGTLRSSAALVPIGGGGLSPQRSIVRCALSG